MRTWVTLVAASALAVSATALAQDSTDPHLGTWVLNLSKSNYDPPSAAPKSEKRTYEATPDGTKMTIHTELSNGQVETDISTFKYDGKPYALMGNPNIDTLEPTLVNGREIRTTELQGGKTVGHVTIVVSKDGKVMTLTQTLAAANGQTRKTVRVYDKQ